MVETPATTSAQTGAKTAATTATTVRAAAGPVADDLGGSPLAAEPQTKKKTRKKKYSRGLRDLQRLGAGSVRAAERIGRAVEVGLRGYRRRSNKSARKGRDGALRDAFENAAIAAGKAIEASARAPRDLAKGLDTKRMWRRARPLARMVATPFFRR